jgi:hypothetical protein
MDEKSEKDIKAIEHVIPDSSAKTYALETAPPEALVIHCGDPRFQKAFREFVTAELGIKSYTPVIIGGGIHALGLQSFLPKNYKILWEQIKFFIKEQKLRQVIIINHEDCAWYKKMRSYHPTIEIPLKGMIDLRTSARTIMKDFIGVNVRMFFAGLDGDKVFFSEVTKD